MVKKSRRIARKLSVHENNVRIGGRGGYIAVLQPVATESVNLTYLGRNVN